MHLISIPTESLLLIYAAVRVVTLLQYCARVTRGAVGSPQVVAAAFKALMQREWLFQRARYILWKKL